MKDIPFTVELDQTTAGEAKPDGEPSASGAPAPGAPGPGAGAEEAPVLTVAQFTRRVRGLLEEQFPLVLVEGEVSNFKRAASGHLYFNLKDDAAQVRCVMFRSAAAGLRFEPENGLQAVARARVSVYEARGEYQLQVLALEPQGTGALQLAFEQLKRRLEAEGLFDPARKRPLPFLPRGIGIVTSAHGAAIRDMLHVLGRRFPTVPVLVYPTAVQGEGAAEQIAAGIAALNRVAVANRLDVLIVGRGGGSIEDLWAFNEEVVARAICASALPVISAVGHEVDFTIADFAADVRAPTPSAAAELVVPLRDELLGGVADLRARLFARSEQALALRTERWQGLRARLGSPEALLQQTAQRLDDLSERVRSAGGQRLAHLAERTDRAREKLAMLRPDRFHRMHREGVRELQRRLRPAAQRHVALLRERVGAEMELLDSLSPLTVMQRGYGVPRHPDGRVVRSVGEVGPGDALHVRLRDGTVESEVRGVRADPAPAPAPGAPPADAPPNDPADA